MKYRHPEFCNGGGGGGGPPPTVGIFLKIRALKWHFCTFNLNIIIRGRLCVVA